MDPMGNVMTFYAKRICEVSILEGNIPSHENLNELGKDPVFATDAMILGFRNKHAWQE